MAFFPASHLTYTNLHDSTLLRGSAAADAATLNDTHDRRQHTNTTGGHTYATTPARTPTHTPTTNAAQCLRQRGGDHWVERGGEMGGGERGCGGATHSRASAPFLLFFLFIPLSLSARAVFLLPLLPSALFFLSRSRLVCLAGICSTALARRLLFFNFSGRQRGRPS